MLQMHFRCSSAAGIVSTGAGTRECRRGAVSTYPGCSGRHALYGRHDSVWPLYGTCMAARPGSGRATGRRGHGATGCQAWISGHAPARAGPAGEGRTEEDSVSLPPDHTEHARHTLYVGIDEGLRRVTAPAGGARAGEGSGGTTAQLASRSTRDCPPRRGPARGSPAARAAAAGPPPPHPGLCVAESGR